MVSSIYQGNPSIFPKGRDPQDRGVVPRAKMEIAPLPVLLGSQPVPASGFGAGAQDGKRPRELFEGKSRGLRVPNFFFFSQKRG